MGMDFTPTPEQAEALDVARTLIDMGVPIFLAAPNHGDGPEFHYPKGWQDWKPNPSVIDRWRPGWALCMVTGVVYDVLDVDPRNGGVEGMEQLAQTLGWDGVASGPFAYGQAVTPSDGMHILIGRTGLAKGKPAPGVDLQAGDFSGQGRGFVFIAPTVRVSKYGERKGQPVAYRWARKPITSPERRGFPTDDQLTALRDHILAGRPSGLPAFSGGTAREVDDDDPFDGGISPWTPDSADRVIRGQLQAVQSAKPGTINSTLGGAARMLGRFVAGGFLARSRAEEMLLRAIESNADHSDRWNRANGLAWTAASVIAAGMAKGEVEPYEVIESPSRESHSARSEREGEPATGAGVTGDGDHSARSEGGGYPRLRVQSAATMAYWLQQEIGRGELSGVFLRDDKVVHTPRVNEAGYVEAKEAADDNGPAEIRPVTPEILSAKIQFSFYCYKEEDEKGEDGKKTGRKIEVPAMFPDTASKRVVNAPEALPNLRVLRGVTHTPMVRADGTVLDQPGYDPASRFLYLPSPGLVVPPVPQDPAPGEVSKAVDLLTAMLQDFPWSSDDDRANYLGLLLTPLLRELAPPSYKMFGISAHQPGSGKSLLAEIATMIHGGVLRSEVPQDEAEWSKQTASILVTTSAPVVVLDNVNGVLKSSVLAGLLTASGEMSQRELGKSADMRFRNDRLWVVTGNNLSLGGDLVRRTITVLIDPDMANPETRTEFGIPDLPRWVEANRGDLIWSLLVLIRSWVAAGMPEAARKQSDSFARWERVVDGILQAAGISGRFDQESGKRAAAGGDDDGLATLLEHLRDRFADNSWSVAEALTPAMEPGTGFAIEGRDWLPTPVLDKLSRSEEAGRKSMGWWLRNRLGRWITTDTGRALVIREAPAERKVARWRIEER